MSLLSTQGGSDQFNIENGHAEGNLKPPKTTDFLDECASNLLGRIVGGRSFIGQRRIVKKPSGVLAESLARLNLLGRRLDLVMAFL
jgi:hypothetical protein